MSEEKANWFAQIPTRLIAQLEGPDLKVVAALVAFARHEDDGWVHQYPWRLAEIAGVDRSTITRRLTALYERGVVNRRARKVRRAGRVSYEYQLAMVANEANVANVQDRTFKGAEPHIQPANVQDGTSKCAELHHESAAAALPKEPEQLPELERCSAPRAHTSRDRLAAIRAVAGPGMSPDDQGFLLTIGHLDRWQRQGATWDDILTVIAAKTAKSRRKPISGFDYFTEPIEEFVARRLEPVEPFATPPPASDAVTIDPATGAILDAEPSRPQARSYQPYDAARPSGGGGIRAEAARRAAAAGPPESVRRRLAELAAGRIPPV